jgi:hypothetical protein
MAVTASTRWDAPADAAAAAAQAGLPMLGQEMLAVHYHAHLDVRIAGTPILVPAGLGIDVARQQISPLHTHDATGVVHIESQADIPYALGQLFIEWGQPLTAGQVGPHRPAPGEVLRVFRNGHPVTSDAAALRFAQPPPTPRSPRPTPSPRVCRRSAVSHQDKTSQAKQYRDGCLTV